ncbi:MAG: phage tail tape measure protein [Muribaculaceae bacterium]|nr:phage tail tape measure protein [Muribaculaceae bacterium]
MSNITDTATVTLVCDGEQAKKELAELQKKFDDASKRVSDLQDKMRDKVAFKAATDNVGRLSVELVSLKAKLKDAEDEYQRLKNDKTSSKADRRRAWEAVRDLKTEVADTSKALREAKKELKEFDPKNLEKAQKELEKVKKRMDDIRSSSQAVQDTLRNLDKVSPRELEKALKALNKEFRNARQGTEEYERLAEQIRAVKEQIESVKDDLSEESSIWERFKTWAFDAWPAIDLLETWYSSALDTMRGFVDAYAEMDQEMASVRKFTGMEDSQVIDLNERFKQLDTRTSREQLNMLAQDAGRLGKQSVDDVMGFVRAADKINVALDDLGQGATLTLSKLTGIFGVEERYGTEQSLLKVGSVINELSQNCSASAPYIANFTERMAGVGAQANMTIPQIMGFAAVLDSNSQAVEASATALSQVLVRLYQEPAKYAKVAGLDVQEFSALLKKDANEAMILFLETLNKAGGMDVLSPMFKDMGENGSRAIASLSTLAGKIEDVKAQQETAAEAFREGTSIGAEFDVQNNTIAANLDKCRNAAHEYQVELGERLYPLMSHFLSSSAAVARALLTALRFLFDHKTAVINLTVAILAYVGALKAAAIHTKILAAETAISNTLFAAWTAATKLASAAFALCTGNIAKARTAWIAFNTALKASPIGLVVAAVALLISHIVQLTSKTNEYAKEADKAMSSATSFAEAVAEETKSIDELFGKLDAAKKGTDEYRKAKDQIISKYGIYLKGLLNEKGEITNLTLAYERLTWAAQKSAQARGVAAAKDALNQTLISTSGDKIERLRTRLYELGKSDRDVERIITEVSMAVGTHTDISSDIRNEVLAAQKKNGSQIAGWFGKDDAQGLVNELGRDIQDFNRRMSSLDKMVTRDFADMSTEDLTKQSDKIAEALKKPLVVDKVPIEITVNSEEEARALVRSYNERIEVKTPAGDKAAPSPYDPAKLSAQSGSNPLAPAGQGNWSDRYDKTGTTVSNSLSWTTDASGKFVVSGAMSRSMAEKMQRETSYELSQRPSNDVTTDINPNFGGTGYVSQALADKERKAQEAEERRRAAKERKEFKQALDDIKGNRAEAETQAMADRSAGLIDYREYIERMREAEVKYYKDSEELYVKNHLEEDEDYKTLLKKKQEADDKYNAKHLTLSKEATEREYAIKEQEEKVKYEGKLNKSLADELAYSEKLLQLRTEKLKRIQSLYQNGSEEWTKYERDLQDLNLKDQQEKQQTIIKKVQEFSERFDRLSVTEKYKLEYETLEKLYEIKKISESEYHEWLKKLREEERKEQEKSLPGAKPETAKSNAENAQKEFYRQKDELDKALADGQISPEEYDVRLRRLKASLVDNLIDPLKSVQSEWVSMMATMIDSWKDFADALRDPEGDPIGALGKGIEATSALMSSVFSQMTGFMQAELQIQTSAVEKRYDREISAAEGNSYRVAKLEKQKEVEIAKLKNEANRKMFAMQVIQAVAQTATNALNAYGSTVVIPVVGPTLAPIAAAVAAAQGAVQIALIKKQQQASETQGYSKGGFTRPGAVDEPAGIVHAGEWVASQKLLASPVARPMIEALDYAQRTNTIGSLRSEDVSRSITAPQTVSRIADGSPGAAMMAAAMSANAGVLDRLARRLEEPFVTVNTVSGDAGIKRAQDEYTKLMNNKSPKSRRKSYANNY